MNDFNKALELKKELDALRPLSPEVEKRIMDKFRLDWNYHSNHLEGNSLTFGETKALILHNITAQGKPLKDHFEITGHNEAVKWVVDLVNGERDLTENFIRELHTLILKESYEVDSITPDGKPTKKRIKVGQYKTSNNHVKTNTGEIFYFATAEETPAKMTDLMNWYHSELKIDNINPILLATEFHYKYIRIHPFDDGNGRTARILMNFILMKFGYPPVVIKTEDKANYFSVLQQADAGTLTPFVEYITDNLNHSLEIMLRGAKGGEIEEVGDVKKELALLEQKFKDDKNYVKVTKSIESINAVFDHFLSDYLTEYFNQYDDFKGFYQNIKIEVFIDGEKVLPNSGLPSIVDTIQEKTNASSDLILAKINFEKFRRLESRNIDYYSMLAIFLEEDHYLLSEASPKESGTNNKVTILKSNYSKFMNKEDVLSNIETHFIRPHFKFIKQTLESESSPPADKSGSE